MCAGMVRAYHDITQSLFLVAGSVSYNLVQFLGFDCRVSAASFEFQRLAKAVCQPRDSSDIPMCTIRISCWCNARNVASGDS